MAIEEFHMLSSEGKKENMTSFIEYIPLLLERKLPTKRALLIMHRLMTKGIHPPIPKFLKEQALLELATTNNPNTSEPADLAVVRKRVKDHLNKVIRKKPNAWRLPKTIRFPSSAKRGRSSGVTVKPSLLRRGHLRTTGVRTIENSESETIFSHITTPISDIDQDGTEITGTYACTTEKVNVLFSDLCDRCDQLQSEAETLDEHLSVIVFLNMMGASVLHPFLDGNGRAFQAKLVFDLHRLGFPVKEMPGFGEVKEALAGNALDGVSVKFLGAFLCKYDLGLVNPGMLSALLNDTEMFSNYSLKLHDAIQAQIQEGIPKDDILGGFIENAVEILKYCLSRETLQANERGEKFGPEEDSPFYIGPEMYRNDIDAIIAANT